jgi:hypothetical protein
LDAGKHTREKMTVGKLTILVLIHWAQNHKIILSLTDLLIKQLIKLFVLFYFTILFILQIIRNQHIFLSLI